MTEYRIEFSIQRCEDGGHDFTEIGFGSSGSGRDLDDCAYAIESLVGNGQWETDPGQPDPASVMRAIRQARERVGGGR